MTKQYKSICDRITQRIIDFLDEGIIPWQKPWVGGSANAPRSVSTKKVYRGTNLAILGCSGFKSPWWLTFGQARKLGGAVRKGQKAYPVHYWKFPKLQDCPLCGGDDHEAVASCPKCDDNGKYIGKFAQLFSFNVFNASQCDGLPEKYYEIIEDSKRLNDFSPIEKADEIVNNYAKVYHDDKLAERGEYLHDNPPTVFHDQQDRNYYSPLADEVHLTTPEQFISNEEYYSVCFHELVHSTGHKDRLEREGVTGLNFFGSHEYSKEELVAEIGSTYLCGIAGIDRDTVIKNSAGYIQSWKKKLEDNTDWIVWAGTRASKACDHILGTEYGKETKKKVEKIVETVKVEEKNVSVGDYVWFKSDIEQGGKIVGIEGNELKLHEPDGFKGDYLRNNEFAYINADDCWIE